MLVIKHFLSLSVHPFVFPSLPVSVTRLPTHSRDLLSEIENFAAKLPRKTLQCSLHKNAKSARKTCDAESKELHDGGSLNDDQY